MDFDFPAPYDYEVPRRIGEARRQLSPEGVAVLEGIIAETGSLEDVIVAMGSLPASDRRVLVEVSRCFAEAYDARMRESEGWAGLQRHLAALILRARELDPSLRAGATLGRLSWYSSATVSRWVSLMRSLRLPSRCRRSSCHWPGRGFRAPAFLGPSRAKTSPIVHRYITHMSVISASIMPLAALFFTPLPARPLALRP